MKKPFNFLLIAGVVSAVSLSSCGRGDHGIEGKYPKEGASDVTDPDNTSNMNNGTDTDTSWNTSGSSDMNGNRNSMNNSGDTSVRGTYNYSNAGSSYGNNNGRTSAESRTSAGTYSNASSRGTQPAGRNTSTSRETYTNPNSVTE